MADQTVTVRVNATNESNLTPTIVGAATEHAALGDDSDSSYIQLSGLQGAYHNYYGFPTPTIPAGAAVTGIQAGYRYSKEAQYCYFKVLDIYAERGVPYEEFQARTYEDDRTSQDGLSTVKEFTTNIYATATEAPINDIWDRDLSTLEVLCEYYHQSTYDARLHDVYLVVYYNEQPEITNVQPDDLVSGDTQTSNPTFEWDYDDAELDPQSVVRLIVVGDTQLDGTGKSPGDSGYDPTTVVDPHWDSGDVVQSTTTLGIGNSVVNGNTYYVYGRVGHAAVIPNNTYHYSDWDNSSFGVDTTPPEDPQLVMAYRPDVSGVYVQSTINGFADTTDTKFMEIEGSPKAFGQQFANWQDLRRMVYRDKATGIFIPNANSDRITTPDHASFDNGNQIQFLIHAAREDWTPASTKALFRRENHFYMELESDGDITFGFRAGATWEDLTLFRTTDIGLTTDNWRDLWINVLVNNPGGGGIAFVLTEYALGKGPFHGQENADGIPGPEDWVLVGTQTPTTAGNIDTTNTQIVVGNDDTPDESWNGVIYEFAFFTGYQSFSEGYQYNQTATAPAAVCWFKAREADLDVNNVTDTLGRVWTCQNDARWTVDVVDRENLHPERMYARTRATSDVGADQASTDWIGDDTDYVTVAIPDGTYWVSPIDTPEYAVATELHLTAMDSKRDRDVAIFRPLGRNAFVGISDGHRGQQFTLRLDFMTHEQHAEILRMFQASEVVYINGDQHSFYAQLQNLQTRYITHSVGYGHVYFLATEVDKPDVVT